MKFRSEERFTCIAIDMGAGSIRVMLGTVDHSGISYQEVHRIPNEIMVVDGHDRWDMECITREIRNGIRIAIDLSPDPPSSIGVDSWGVDVVLLDEKGNLVEIPVAYRDKRTEGMQEQWSSIMPELETFQRTGINFYIFNTLFQLLSIRQSKELTQTEKILFIPSYINYLLSGVAFNELTIASTSQMLGVNDDQWDSEILKHLQVDRSQMGKVIHSGSRLGTVTLPETEGIHVETVAVCGHDTACVVAAIPAEDPEYAFISAGTWCIVGVESSIPLISAQAMKLGFTNERGYNNSYRILKNIVGLWLIQGLKKQLPEETTYEEMEQMIQQGGARVPVIDPDDPGFYNPVDMKAAFDDFFTKTGQHLPAVLGDYIRCAYNSICFSFRYHMEQLEEFSGKPIGVLHVVGGGSQSDYLNQRIATICEKEVISGPVEGAAIGNIMIQAMAMGRIKDLKEGRSLIRRSFPSKSYRPGSVTEVVREQYDRYLQLKNINL